MGCRICSVACLVPLLVAGLSVSLVAAGGWGAPAPAVQPEKKDQPKKDEPKKEEPKKEEPKKEKPKEEAVDAYVLGFKMKRIDGKEEDLSIYKGKVVVMVNVASKCGYTPQYKALEELYKQYKDQGLVILGFPANNFGSQEPGSNSEIASFCKSTYDVTFPLFEKISVKGEDQHPLYKKLVAQPAPIGGDPKWNFTKFVVNKEGKVVVRVDAKSREGLEPQLVAKVEELLGVKKEEKKKEEPKKPPSGS